MSERIDLRDLRVVGCKTLEATTGGVLKKTVLKNFKKLTRKHLRPATLL